MTLGKSVISTILLCIISPAVLIANTATYTEIPLLNSSAGSTPLYNDTFLNKQGANPPAVLGTEMVPFYFGPAGNQFLETAFTTTDQFSLAANVSNPDAAYLLLNTDWGAQGFTTANVTFVFKNQSPYTIDIVDGVNVRDWNIPSGYPDNVTSANVEQAVFSHFPDNAGSSTGVIDMLYVDLSNYSSDTLQQINFNLYGSDYQSRLIVEGVTIKSASAVPEPDSLILLGSGFTFLAGTFRRKHRA